MPRRDDLSLAADLERRASEARKRHESRLAIHSGGFLREIERARRSLGKVYRSTNRDESLFAAMERLEEMRRQELGKRAAQFDGKAEAT